MPSVSVIIPTFNHSKLIVQTLESVFAQTFSDFEVLVVNDGSPDDTTGALRQFISAGRIRYFEKKNGGQADARNFGLARAQADLIAFIDDDDLWPRDKLEWQVDAMASSREVGMIFGSVRLFGSQDFELPGRGTWPDPTFESIFDGCPLVSPGQSIIRKAAITEIGGFDKSIWGADDWDLYFRLGKKYQLKFVNKLSLHYRCHQSNASRDSRRMLKSCERVIIRHLSDVPEMRRETTRSRATASLSHHYLRKLRSDSSRHLRNYQFREASITLKAFAALAVKSYPSLALKKLNRLVQFISGKPPETTSSPT